MPPRRQRNAPLLTEEEVLAKLPLLEQGVREFNQGLFFQAHETWEELWVDAPWPVRHFLQGLIQVAAALVHMERGEFPGTHRLLREALRKLDGFPAAYLGIDNARLIEEGRRCLDAVLVLGERGLPSLDRTLLPQIRMEAGGAEETLAPAGN